MIQAGTTTVPPRVIDNLNARAAAQEMQRQQQQGLGRPIISAVHEGRRYVLVGPENVYHSTTEHWATFVSFLRDYVKAALDRTWFEREYAKTTEDRHPVMSWFGRAAVHDAAGGDQPKDFMGFVRTTGAIAAIAHLSYDLYSLAHNIELRAKLLDRLRDSHQFQGARHEIFVAASLIRAGYSVEFENEDDRTRTHCEFTATAPSGKQYSVEAKCRQHSTGTKHRLKLGKLLSSALRKHAAHKRLVFIEMGLPDAGSTSKNIEFYRAAIRDMRRHQEKFHPGKAAYLVVTNFPLYYHLDETKFNSTICVDGFGIADFGFDVHYGSLREQYLAKMTHLDIVELNESLKRDINLPITFDGDIPELVYAKQQPGRLIIGKQHIVPGVGGTDVRATLVDAVVVPGESHALCAYQMSDGQRVLYSVLLTEAELAAHKAHPETFFGVIRAPHRGGYTHMELFEFFLATYRKRSTTDLIKLFEKAGIARADVAGLDHDELALRYAEGATHGAIRRRGESKRKRHIEMDNVDR